MGRGFQGSRRKGDLRIVAIVRARGKRIKTVRWARVASQIPESSKLIEEEIWT